MTNRMSVTAPCLAVMGLAMALTACNQKPTESIRDMMVGRVQPTAQTYWNAVQYISDEKGTHNIVPRNAAEWDRTRKAAEDLSDYGRQLQTRAYSQGRGEDWNQFAQGLVDIGAAAADAARSRNPDAVFDAGTSVYNVCAACHQVYLPRTTSSTKAPVIEGPQ